jgi:hypothetical protein
MFKRSLAWIAALGIVAGSLSVGPARADDKSDISELYVRYNQNVMLQDFSKVRAFWEKSVSPGYLEKGPGKETVSRKQAETADIDLVSHIRAVNELDYRIKSFESKKGQSVVTVFTENNFMLFSDKGKKAFAGLATDDARRLVESEIRMDSEKPQRFKRLAAA